MSVPAGYEPKAYISDGSLSPRSIEWPFLDSSDVVVSVNGTVKSLNIHYQIIGAYPGAQIQPLAGFAADGDRVEYRRSTLTKQDYRINQPALDRVKMERELDRQAMAQQEQAATQSDLANGQIDLATRAITVPVGEIGYQLPPASARRGDSVLSVDPVSKRMALRPASYFATGPRGPNGYSLRTLDQLRAAPVTDFPLNYDRAVWDYIEGDFSDTPFDELDVSIVESDHVDLSVGALVRQEAGNLRVVGGGNVQDALMAAVSPVALMASGKTFPIGSTLRTADGAIYAVQPADATEFHLQTAGGVKLNVASTITPESLGAPCDGIGDDAPFFERAWQLAQTVTLRPQGVYRLASMIGLPDVNTQQGLSADQALMLDANGATIICNSPLIGGVPEAIFTSATAKANPATLDDAYSGKLYIEGGNWTSESDWAEPTGSVIFNGDRLYQIYLRGCNFARINNVVKSYRTKQSFAEYPEGYLQSLIITQCQFTLVQRIVNAKRAFQVFFNNNFASFCYGGIYIDSTIADAAVTVLSITSNLFQGGGCALVVGKFQGLSWRDNYLESNTIGDAAEAKCDVWFKAGPSPSTGGTIAGGGCQPHPDQISDPDYATFRVDYTPVPPISPPIEAEFVYTTGGNFCTRGKMILRACGSSLESTLRSAVSPYSPQSAKRTTVGGTRTIVSAATYHESLTNLTGGSHRVASIDCSDIMDLLAVNQRPVKGEISILIQHKGPNAVVSGTSHAIIGFVIMPASEGVGAANRVDALYGTFALKDFMEIGPGEPIDALGAVTAVHFTSPTLSVTKTGPTGPFHLFLSSYSPASLLNYGSDDRLTAHITIEADALNNSGVLASPIRVA